MSFLFVPYTCSAFLKHALNISNLPCWVDTPRRLTTFICLPTVFITCISDSRSFNSCSVAFSITENKRSSQCWKMAKHTSKILQCSHRKIFKVGLAIFQHLCMKAFIHKALSRLTCNCQIRVLKKFPII